jgi:hypothetical protein
MKVLITQRDIPPPIPAGAAGGIVAAPGDQNSATVLTARVNIVTNAAAGTAVRLKNILGNQQTLLNRGAFSLTAYPEPGTQIEGYGLNQPAQLVVGGNATFTYDNNITWYVT